MSFTLIGTAVTKDIILSSISTTISTTTSIIKFLLCQKESELDVFKRELFKSDLCNNLDIDASIIAQKTISNISDNITTKELDLYSANICAGLGDYDHNLLGGRILASNLQKTKLTNKSGGRKHLMDNKLQHEDKYNNGAIKQAFYSSIIIWTIGCI